MKFGVPYLLLVAGAFLWCAAILVTPMLAESSPGVAATLAHAFAPVCHQDPARSLVIGGHPCPVCFRCLAIYLGFLVAVSLAPLFRGAVPRAMVAAWVVAAAPMVVDVLCDMAGLHAGTTMSRLISGGWFGLIAGLLLTPLLVGALRDVNLRLTAPMERNA